MKNNRFLLITGLILVIIIAGVVVFNNNDNSNNEILEVKAVVLKTDDSTVQQAGMVKLGNQMLTVKILEGKYKGQRVEAINGLTGKLQLDNYFKEDDKILVAITEENDDIRSVKAIDLCRQGWQLLLCGIFTLLLIIYAGKTGVKAMFSFIASLFLIWKILIPGLLAGQDPLFLSSIMLVMLSAIIIFSVAGLNKKGLAAFFGTVIGLFVTIGIAVFFGNNLNLQGMTAPFSQILIFSGHMDLNMREVLYAAIVIGASGAAMDIAMDVAASMAEIKAKKPDISMNELTQSGFNVGRAVIGTMTTTLLLAYSGGYLTLLMLFHTKHTSISRMINLKMVSAEILRTITGSIGLVLVAPITAVFAGWIYTVDLKELLVKYKEDKLTVD